jgi:hypothetical protein
MRSLLLIFLQAALLILLHPSSAVLAQAPPADFKISLTVGGSAPWAEKTTVAIDSAGGAHYARYTTGETAAIHADTVFTVSMDDLARLWKTIQDSSFFALTSLTDTTVQDGEFAKVTVTANGAAHQVVVKNAAVPRLDGIISALNAIIPPVLRVSYNPPGSLNIVPTDPCGSSSGTLGIVRKRWDPGIRFPADLKTRLLFDARSVSIAGTTADLDIPHAGTVVAYHVSIQDAIKKKIAKLSSKGQFFGDGVSITVDNTKAPPSNTISITLFLEFYGPQATQANIKNIEADIAQKWNGLTTSGGNKINIEFVTRSDVNSVIPPSTPGYHQIKLVPKDAVRSEVDGNPMPNAGVSHSTWSVDDDAGVYGHEAGHLMGLPDRYVDYNKQADGTWKNSKTGQSYANDNTFANYVVTKYPELNLTTVRNFLKTVDVYGIPLDGSENDLMAKVSKRPLQSDIDQIAANPGVLVTVPAGTVFINRKLSDQNLITTHRDDLFVKPGEKRTQNGIYIACIDHTKGLPTSNVLFDISPPLETWKGIAAAGPMANLTQYIDSVGLYCGSKSAVQEAVWRISDNTQPLALFNIDTILTAAGVNLGSQIMDFPHLSPGPSNDTSSQSIIPNELFVAAITPRFAAGRSGSPVSLSAGVSVPSVTAIMPRYAWSATAPDSTPVAVTASDSTGSFTPKQSGIYEVALQFSYDDSLYGPRAFTSDRKAYVIVPNDNTETFEHGGLADKFPWTSMGDVPWTISSTNAQTGTFAAQAGTVSSGQLSTLAITVSLPADSAVGFSVRTALTESSALYFSIDSTGTDYFDGLSDWQMVRYPLKAGRHLLTWSFSGGGSNAAGNAWLDNIFFPGSVVATSVAGQNASLPLVFELEQNYPNPFNPATVIRYGLPHRSDISLIVYNTLGQKVADLAQGVQEAGYHEVTFDGSKLASGVYFYTLRAGGFVQTRKLLLVK